MSSPQQKKKGTLWTPEGQSTSYNVQTCKTILCLNVVSSLGRSEEEVAGVTGEPNGGGSPEYHGHLLP